MILNYLKTTLRYLWKQKTFSLINIVGLSISIAICLVIFLYVQKEKSYDTFFPEEGNIHRVLRIGNLNGENYLIGVTAAPFADALVNDFPGEIKEAVRIFSTEWLVSRDEVAFYESNVVMADSNFFNLFPYPLAIGNPATALKDPSSIILTQEIAAKYFGNEDPINKRLLLGEEYDFIVTGVFDELPASHIEFDFVTNNRLLHNLDFFSGWWNNAFLTYISFHEGADPNRIEERLPAFMDKYFGNDFATSGSRIDLTLQPIDEVYFESNVRYDEARHGNLANLYIFTAVAIFILLVACINFINLAIAKSIRRAKEVGIRKTLGSGKKSLVFQFILESVIISFIAIIIGFGFIELSLPHINSWFTLDLNVDNNLPLLLPLMLIVLVVTGLLSGSYPAFIISSYKPIQVLKGRFNPGREGFNLRKILVVVQFVVSVLLIVITLVIGKQFDYMQTKDLGFTKDHVLILDINNDAIRDSQQQLVERLRNHPAFTAVSLASGEPGGFHDASAVTIAGMDEQPRLRTLFTDESYAEVFDLQIVAGRNFSRERIADQTHSMLINEKAAREIGWSNEEALGKRMSISIFDTIPREVIGVVKDYHFSSLKSQIEPLMISYRSGGRTIALKVKSNQLDEAVVFMKSQWDQYSPKYPMTYSFLDESIERLYANERLQSRLITSFSAIAIFVACLGIFGLASLMAVQRMKEVGIRKVLGASVLNISSLMTKEFLLLVVIANIIAWPLGYLLSNRWLEQFVYKTDVSPYIFIVALLLVAIAAIGSMLYQVVKAALVNPVDVLKDE